MASSREDNRRRRDGGREPLPAAVAAARPSGGDAGSDVTLRDFLFRFAIIVLASLWIYSPTYHGDWLWDDDQLLTQNPTVQHRVSPDPSAPADSLASLRKLWLDPDGADYFPLSYTALWVQWPFFSVPKPQPNGSVLLVAWPTGYHVVTILCHVLGSLLFWRLLVVMRVPGAWLGGLLFAIHPACVETVGWVSEVKNTVSLPLFLLACIAFVRSDADRGAAAPHGWAAGSPNWYGLSLFLFLAAMLAKTSVVMFPVVILVYGWWKYGLRIDRRGLLTLVGLAASLAFSLVVMMVWLAKVRAGKTGPDELSSVFWTCAAVATLGPAASIGLAVAVFRGRPAAEAEAGGGRRLERYVLRSMPFFWISLLLGLATCYFQWSRAIGEEKILIGGVASRIATAGMAILFYLWTALWPFDLLTIYPRWNVTPPKPWQFLPWPIMAAAVWGLWIHRGTADRPTWQRHVLFGFAFFVLMLFPILGFITISYMRITWVADHFLYLPMLSVIGLVAAGIAIGSRRLGEIDRSVALVAGAVLLTCLGYSSFRYAQAWAGEESLWPHTIAGHPDPCTYPSCGCWQAHNRLGAKKFDRGDLDGAHMHFQNSTRLRPDLGETHNNLGTTHSARSQVAAQRGDEAVAKREQDLAIAQFREAYRVTPQVLAIQANLANALGAAGLFGEAADHYRQLLERMPGNPGLWQSYGVALFKMGEKEPAIRAFRRALQINPNFREARESLAMASGETAASDAAAPPPRGQLELSAPQSPTLGPAPLGP